MRTGDTIVPDITSAIRWMARASSILLLVFVVVVFINEGREIKLAGLKPGELVMTLSLLMAILGLLVAWLSEGLGGLLTIIGLLTFSIVNYFAGGDFAWEIWVLGLPAILFIIYWWRTY